MLLLGAQCHGLWQEGDCQKQGLSTGRATPEADDVLLAFPGGRDAWRAD